MKKLFQKIKDTFCVLSLSKGFTLLELLVVVLIIGILASIALPKYQLAVDKAEFAKQQTVVHSLKAAYENYLLTNNTTTSNFNNLSISLGEGFSTSDVRASYTYTCKSNADMHCCITKQTEAVEASVYCMKKDYSFGYLEEILTKEGKYSTRKECFANCSISSCGVDGQKSRQYKLCKAVSSQTPDKGTTLFTPDNTRYLGLYSFFHFPIK